MLLNTPPVLMSSLSAEWWRRWLCPELRATWEQCGSGAPGTATGRGGVHLQPDSVEGGPQGGGHHADSEHKQPGLPRWAVSGWNAHAPQDALMPQTHAFRLGTARSPARAVPKLVLVRAFHKLSWSGGLGVTGCSWPGCLMPASWDSLNYLPPLRCGKPWGFATQEQRKCVSSCSFHGAPTSPV